MADLRRARTKTKKQPLGALAKAKIRKNTSEPVRPSLAALKARKQAGPALARIKERKRSPDDFTVNGVLYHNPRVIEFRGDSPLGTVDVTTGIKTYRMSNQAGSWMYPLPDHKGYFKEPAALGLGGQLEVCTNLNARFARYLKEQGILTAAQKRVQRDMQEKAERKRQFQPKRSLAALKTRKGKTS